MALMNFLQPFHSTNLNDNLSIIIMYASAFLITFSSHFRVLSVPTFEGSLSSQVTLDCKDNCARHMDVGVFTEINMIPQL